ncbi:flagellar basal body L-ring protein FlgH [Pluralibacter sp.]|uniref:flagellar basal body L-ring protein FlgH n=1 Tax=Pluralibacter sp. TaxID=1920032 RepID=UPI0025EEC696|nr:flagellar basal body L-ring protein FlgH [Pluralibacter sp.]
MSNWPKGCALVVMGLLMQGCAPRAPESQNPPEEESFAPPQLESQPVTYASQGTLYNRSYVMTLFQDRRAYRVGDMLTVSLDEKTTSSKQADTRYGKSSDASIGGDSSTSSGTPKNFSGNINANRDFDGSAQSSQKNSLQGAITVVVASVLPNGNLQVRGEKWLKLNQGDEYIRLSGLVRVEDIDGLNRVSSQRLADARISYTGRGTMADSNNPGWLTKFFYSPLSPI